MPRPKVKIKVVSLNEPSIDLVDGFSRLIYEAVSRNPKLLERVLSEEHKQLKQGYNKC